MEVPFKIISIEHFVGVAVCVSFIVLFPRLFKDKDEAILKTLRVSIVVLILTFQILDFYKVVYLFGDPWKTALPLHLCDFSAISIAGYMLTGNKHLFNFAFFWGIAGAGMAILTPNSVHAFRLRKGVDCPLTAYTCSRHTFSLYASLVHVISAVGM